MAVNWDSYLPDVLLEVPGCPSPVAIHAIRGAAIMVCQDEHVWREELAAVNLVAAAGDIAVPAPAGSEIVSVLRVGFYAVGQTKALEVAGPVDAATLDSLRPGWRDEINVGTRNSIEACAYPSTKVLRVIPKPVVNQTGAIAIYAALKPTRASVNGPDLLFNEYLETVVMGAQAKLLAIPGKPWTDYNAAAYKSGQFMQMKTNAGIRVLRGAGSGSLTAYQRSLGSDIFTSQSSYFRTVP